MGRAGGMLLLILVFASSIAHGDASPPSHECTAPLKQREFTSQFQLDRYKSAVELYRSCLDAFVREQEKAIEIHRLAAHSAIDDWNRFVGKEAQEPSRAPEDKGGGHGAE